jgi:hypothetical protein
MEREYKYKFADNFMIEQGFKLVNGQWVEVKENVQ